MTPYGTDEPNKERRRDGPDSEHRPEYAKTLRHRARQASSSIIADELDMMAEEVELEVLDAYEYDEKEFDREMVNEFRRALASATEARAAMLPPDPPPRYDDVFFEGVRWLNDQ